ncbi:flagellar biosynthetic protein FliR [Enterobacter sp. BIGb0383]|uniref:flagellar biosynthetic protein FliR n=1 Tax=unclassified Enterobacter TaxID=2608935 RepID=UPI000F489187|nr:MULTISPECIES: flagellar biosynthetic protein FliR [unclassified Enterobacter]ROP58340.1 flagellar biosynthetic protein FliR [Enterobacter sp. BIGb0383]ROS06772.1 flagellar biosynthetic protein FliR [Enterobacter sp. BIGb0359]
MQSLSLADLYSLIGHYFWPLTRTLAMFSAAPVFSEKVAGRKVKIGLAVLIAFLIGQNLPDSHVVLVSADGLWVTAKQILIGSAIGLTIQFIFAAMRNAGEIIGLQMGLSFASFFDPSGNQNTPVIARLLNLLFTLLFLSLNGHLYLIQVLADSFTLLPVNAAPLHAGGFYLLLQTAGVIFSCGLKVGMPMITLLLALNLTLGLLNRLTPQLSIFVIGFPLAITGGLGALLLLMVNFAPIFNDLMNTIFHHLNTILLGFR